VILLDQFLRKDYKKIFDFLNSRIKYDPVMIQPP